MLTELSKLQNHPHWVPKLVFLGRLRRMLYRHRIFGKRINVVEFIQSLPNVELSWTEIDDRRVGGWCNKGNNLTTIALNQRRSPKANQFDAAHELVHHWFHPTIYEMHWIDDDHRRILDIQANWGAREITMPEGLFRKAVHTFRGPPERLIYYLSNFFMVGIYPVCYRLIEFGLLPLETPTTISLPLKHLVIRREILLNVSEEIEVDNKRRFLICPRCKNRDFSPEASFCKRCGLCRANECTSCEHWNVPDAAYCESCGSVTYLFIEGLVKSWEGYYREPEIVPSDLVMNTDEIPF